MQTPILRFSSFSFRLKSFRSGFFSLARAFRFCWLNILMLLRSLALFQRKTESHSVETALDCCRNLEMEYKYERTRERERGRSGPNGFQRRMRPTEVMIPNIQMTPWWRHELRLPSTPFEVSLARPVESPAKNRQRTRREKSRRQAAAVGVS